MTRKEALSFVLRDLERRIELSESHLRWLKSEAEIVKKDIQKAARKS